MKTPATLKLAIDGDLYLREAVVEDAPVLYELIDAGRPYLREWLPFIDYTHAVSDTEAFLKAVTAPGNASNQLFTILYQKQVAGIIDLKEIDFLNRKLEIGYWLGENYQGKGIMYRSCKTLIRYAFRILKMNRIQIKVGVGNSRSSNIPKRLGFTLEGIQRDGEYLNEHFHDLEVYSLLQHEWDDSENIQWV
ncbi:ribosomal-protein-serine acetyltransferase [Pontibacter ummariensis]|uniref:Ribosomal-protein-serine acetyltransferase n=1 Tax=Pontibacter ummariensis TaxID=1610492 RepID=A0A239D5W2_9BACT|nr:GNAT family protein [Pontibacter ummariensis]PRY14257.1 ribosomal-protein-serine acetyltransferase [Pontibacter ummariensis]SNS27532.1 ribosomal-protein-serine acetyltransferase [Pontibacter ummariensis]